MTELSGSIESDDCLHWP